ncbi:MAG TPA: helix-turn-helix transcriptional regulator [Candidatus Acidoferrales bacterium]|nr:helix-turn-helix transcriptional regulator [Candidatus Acidoferrales bacterium]
MRQHLNLPAGLDGNLWHYRHQGRNAMHRHAELELNLVTSGSGLYLLENRKYEIRRGDLLWLFPAQEHVLVEQSADFGMWIGVFKPKTLARLATDAGAKILRQRNPAGEFCRRLPQPALARLEQLFSEIVAPDTQPGLFNTGLAYTLLSAWEHFEHAADVPVRDVHPAVEKAARIIRHESNLLGLTEIARRAGLSAHRLSRLFKQQTGVALVDFRNRQRVEKFMELYGTGQRRTMLDAALDAGFGSYAQFYRVFKHVTGSPPGSHRRK